MMHNVVGARCIAPAFMTPTSPTRVAGDLAALYGPNSLRPSRQPNPLGRNRIATIMTPYILKQQRRTHPMLLNNRYQLQERTGRGSMAEVYRGYDQHLKRFVALKILREVYNTDPKFITRFQREVKITTSL